MKKSRVQEGSLMGILKEPVAKPVAKPDVMEETLDVLTEGKSRLDALITRLCPDGVDFKPISSLCSTVTPQKKLNKKEYKDNGLYPIVDQGQQFIVAYTNDEDALIAEGQYVIFGDHTREIKYVDFAFAQGADGIKILKASHFVMPRFLYHSMLNLKITSRGYNRHWGIVSEEKIPVPPLPVQEEIVRILDTFAELTAELTAELAKRKQQYQYYKQKIFNINKNIEYKTLKELCGTIKTGKLNANARVENGKYPFFTCDFQPYRIDTYAFDTTAILMAGNGYLGTTHIYSGKFNAYQRTYVLYNFRFVNVRYLYHYIQTYIKDYFLAHCKMGSVPYVTLPTVQNFLVPVPPLPEQQRIVSILDRFDTLCNDTTYGLPAEIEARKKQYEYYRDRLLTFKEAGK